MSNFVLLVDFEVNDGMGDALLPLVSENARKSVENEPGCLQFDVVRAQDNPNRFMLYEVYADETAFQAHTKQQHVADFLAKARPMMGKTTMTRLTRQAHPTKR
jgi:(4S)-4-hydroxy-5-phosphonooxypentane-2,3-dione isomerase